MAFFKNILSDVLGDNIANALTGETAQTIAKGLGQRAAKGAMNAAAESASEMAVKKAIDKASSALNRTSPLDTPPPPAVPEFQSLSVMVAVNGQTFGPYERATLLEMIENGSLTRDTFVYIKGMSNWAKASDVEQVASLFGDQIPVPPAPPMPWANAPQPTVPSQNSDNSLSPRLNQLITAAVADGEISDLERQVLIRNAQEEGVAMDEFVMVLEARLFEQRQVLIAKQKQHEAMQASSVQIPVPQPEAKVNKMDKCPACGAPIKAMATECPECGYEYSAGHHGECSAWERLNQMLTEVDKQKPSGLMGNYLSLMGMGDHTPEKISKKKRIIINFPIPSDKKGIMDFFISCATIAKDSGGFFNRDNEGLSGAYRTKAKQVLIKARVIMKDDAKLLNELNEIAKQYKIKA